MSLQDLVRVNISAQTATPTRPGFGTILIAAQKVPATVVDRVRRYGSLTEMTDAGFAVTDPAYLCAQRIKAQSPSPVSWLVGKRLNKVTQTVKLTCTSAIVGDVYKITVGSTTYTYTVPTGAPTTSTVATALAALIDAHASVAAVAAGAVITCTTSTAGELVDYSAWTNNLQFEDATADGPTGGLAADLAAIKAATNEDWYGLALDSQSKAEIAIAALFVETEKKLFVANNSDYGCGDPAVITDAMSATKTAAYARTGVLWSKRKLLSYSGAAWTSKQFAGATPGSDTWAFKTIASVDADTISAGEYAAILAKKGNLYSPVSGINITERGTSGSGEFLDITRFVDWQTAELQFRFYSALVNNSKLPYTQSGAEAIGAIIKSGLLAGVDAGGLEPGTVNVIVPTVANISPAVRATRVLSGMRFSAKLAGAIHELDLEGILSP